MAYKIDYNDEGRIEVHCEHPEWESFYLDDMGDVQALKAALEDFRLSRLEADLMGLEMNVERQMESIERSFKDFKQRTIRTFEARMNAHIERIKALEDRLSSKHSLEDPAWNHAYADLFKRLETQEQDIRLLKNHIKTLEDQAKDPQPIPSWSPSPPSKPGAYIIKRPDGPASPNHILEEGRFLYTGSTIVHHLSSLPTGTLFLGPF